MPLHIRIYPERVIDGYLSLQLNEQENRLMVDSLTSAIIADKLKEVADKLGIEPLQGSMSQAEAWKWLTKLHSNTTPLQVRDEVTTMFAPLLAALNYDSSSLVTEVSASSTFVLYLKNESKAKEVWHDSIRMIEPYIPKRRHLESVPPPAA